MKRLHLDDPPRFIQMLIMIQIRQMFQIEDSSTERSLGHPEAGIDLDQPPFADRGRDDPLFQIKA